MAISSMSCRWIEFPNECGNDATHFEYASTVGHPIFFQVPTCNEHRGAGVDADGKSLAACVFEHGKYYYQIGDRLYSNPLVFSVDSPETWEQ
jgi:hypothetical protein